MPSSRSSAGVVRRLVVAVRALVLVAVAAVMLTPATSGAQEEGPSEGRDQSRREEEALVDIDIDVLQSDDSDVEAALGDISENIDAQVEALEQARAAVATADQNLAAADLAVAETQNRLNALSLQTDQVVIGAYINPPAEAALDAFAAESLTDLSVKQSILNTKATSDAETLEMYWDAKDQLQVQKAERSTLSDAAQDGRDTAAAALADLESALSQQARFAIQVEERLDQRLAEAGSLANVDPALAAQIQTREAQLAGTLSTMQEEARRIAAQENSAALAEVAEGNKGYGTIKQPPGGLATVGCPNGGSIQVAGDIAGQVTRLLQDAAAAGLPMCGGGYRDPADQIAVRKANCGPSNYDIYEAPSSACSPPTARPGTSMHEQGLAIDFTCSDGGSVSYGDSCHDWLRAHAADYGLYQLPSEPWHWSVNAN